MPQEPLADKLSELFDLHRSGIITIDEYNLLKSEFLNENINSAQEETQIKQHETFYKARQEKAVFQDKIIADPSNIELHHDYAKYLMSNQLTQDAIIIFKKILEIDKNDDVAKNSLIESYLKLGWNKEALIIAEQQLLNNQKNIPLLEKLVTITSNLGNLIKSEEFCDQILSIAPTNTTALYFKAVKELKENKLDKAIGIFKYLYEIGNREKLTVIYFGIGKALNGEFENAIDLLRPLRDNKEVHDLDNSRVFLYFAYSLSQRTYHYGEVVRNYARIDFSLLKQDRHNFDERIAIKIIEWIVLNGLNEISKEVNPQLKIEQLVNNYLKNDIIASDNNSILAELWYAIGNKQVELDLLIESLNTIQKALYLMPNEQKYRIKYKEVKEILSARKRKKAIISTLIILPVSIGIIVILLIGKNNYNKEKKTFEFALQEKTDIALKAYTDQYPNGRYKERISDIEKEIKETNYWNKCKLSNSYELYLTIYPRGIFAEEAKKIMQTRTNRIQEQIQAWDEIKAKETILSELKSFKGWSQLIFEENPSIQEIIGFKKVEGLQEPCMVALAFTNKDFNDCHSCTGTLSFFEFKFSNGWQLTQKNIGFTDAMAWSYPNVDHDIVLIASNKYGLMIKESSTYQGESSGKTSLFTHLDDSLKCVLSVVNQLSNIGAGGTEDYNSHLVIYKSESGYYPIELIEKGEKGDGTRIDNKIKYEFNGEKYINKSGSQPYGHGY